MLGHAPLGVWALGQLPSADAVALGASLSLELSLTPGLATGGAAGDAIARGAFLELTLALEAGAATGVQTVTIAGGGPSPTWRDALAPGARLELWVALRPGRAHGERHIDAVAGGELLPFTIRIAAGAANGDATGYDNDFVLLLAA